MSTYSFPIEGRDYDRAGAATGRVKEMLRRVGVDPPSVRRAMIAAYEAEMNVVIHARRGRMDVRLSPEALQVDVIDEGPGIPDVDKALTEGFSTAGSEARELGFGAGMGLPNIRRSTDRMSIKTEVGRGTHLCFVVNLRDVAAPARGDARNSLWVREERCRRCLSCVRACPTQAIRVRARGPEVLGHLCVDCGECIRVCSSGALGIREDDGPTAPAAGRTLIVPSFLRAEFEIDENGWQEMGRALGFESVRGMEAWDNALVAAACDWALESDVPRPVILPTCPAVVNLIATRFPSLMDHVAPFATPAASAATECPGEATQFIVACPGQRTAVETSADPPRTRTPSALRPALMEHRRKRSSPSARPRGDWRLFRPTWIAGGPRHVVRVLETIERDEWPAHDILELYLCDGGCWGSPLSLLGAPLARRRFSSFFHPAPAALAIRSQTPPTARSGRRLADSMSEAMDRLGRIDRVARGLPGKDCAACGAPTCDALAEDIVLERAGESDCPWLTPREETTS